MPAHLFLEKELLLASQRLLPKVTRDWDGKSFGLKKGHIKYAEDKYIDSELGNDNTDEKQKEIMWHKRFTVNKDSLSTGTDMLDGVRCYTDGSKIGGKVGFGLCIYHGDSPRSTSTSKGRLRDECSVFQAELAAIAEAPGKLQEYLDGDNNTLHINKVTILSDSQAAIKALQSTYTTCKSTQKAIENINKLGESINVEIRWIKAHVNYPGNEEADKLAKEGAGLDNFTMDVPISKNKN